MNTFKEYYIKEALDDRILFGIVSYDKIDTKWGTKGDNHDKLGLRVTRFANSFRYKPTTNTLAWWNMSEVPQDERDNVIYKLEGYGYKVDREFDMSDKRNYEEMHK
jgi:hypothetical protein